MPDIPAPVWIFSTLASVLFAWAGQQPNAPWFCRWPYTLWDFIAHSWRRPTPVPPRPDYARIDRLERELGLVEERPIRPGRTVCLTKNCAGDTEEIRTWSGQLITRVHHCQASSPD
ncbi:hypothetical protein [Streptomyces parvulus]|uniref:hypothetical protein n=1 Tax=Streptomyces parvulus TaxID=146923 RepID=UPI00339E870E